MADDTVKKETKGSKVVTANDVKKNNRFALKVDLEAPEPAPEDDKTGVKKTNKEAAK